MNWGLYRNARFSMAEILKKESKPLQAIDLLLEVCYLDLNGPNNCGGVKDGELLKQFPPFDPKTGELLPGIVGRLYEIMVDSGQTAKMLEPRFVEIGNRLFKSLGLPLQPDKAWRKIKREITAA